MEKVKVSELRKGNIINGVYQLEEANGMHYTICKFLGYHPFDNYIYVESKDGIEEFIQFNTVILDEEILLKCGFEVKPFSLGLTLDRFRFIWKTEYKYWYVVDAYSQSYLTKIEFVHELQNFIFVMNGQELNTSELTKND